MAKQIKTPPRSEPTTIRAIEELMRERLSEFFEKKLAALAQLPSHSSEELILQGKKITLSVWHDVLPSHEHRIVVQAYKAGMLGIGRMSADGFVVNDNNEKRSLTLDEWAPFS